jgi:hypothetical protein
MNITVLGRQEEIRRLFDSGCGLPMISSTSEGPGVIRALLQERTLAISFEPAVGRLISSKLAAILEMITHVAAREKIVLWFSQARKQKFAERTTRFVTQDVVEIRQVEKLADILVGSQASPDGYHLADRAALPVSAVDHPFRPLVMIPYHSSGGRSPGMSGSNNPRSILVSAMRRWLNRGGRR